MHPNIESTVQLSQAKQKALHDLHSKEREFTLGQLVLAKNFRQGAKWLPGKIIERLGLLTYLVQVKENLTWKRHVDQLRSRLCQSDNTSLTPEPDNSVTFPSEQFDENSDTDVVPITAEPTTEVLPSVSATPSTPRYPHRDNRKPPDRLMYNRS